MYYPSDDLDTPPQPRYMEDSGVTADDDDDDVDTSAGGGAAGSSNADGDTPAGGGGARGGGRGGGGANNNTTTTTTNNNNNNDDEEEEEEEDDEVGDDGTATGGGAGGGTAHPPGVPPPLLMVIPACSNLDALYGLREIGREALCWQLSSAKPGNGVEQIRDHSTETYWQSDGTSQPHWIQAHFARRVAISHVCLYLDYNLDESYTPRRLSVQVGMTNHDLVPAILPDNTLVEFQEPVGWCIVPLRAAPDPLEDDEDDGESDEENEDEDEDGDNDPSKKHPKRVVKAHLVQISILSQHQNGRDTHVRQVQLYGPRTNSAAALRKVHAQGMEESANANTNKASVSAGQSSRLYLQRGRHWDEEFSTLAMSQFSTIR